MTLHSKETLSVKVDGQTDNGIATGHYVQPTTGRAELLMCKHCNLPNKDCKCTGDTSNNHNFVSTVVCTVCNKSITHCQCLPCTCWKQRGKCVDDEYCPDLVNANETIGEAMERRRQAKLERELDKRAEAQVRFLRDMSDTLDVWAAGILSFLLGIGAGYIIWGV